MECEDGPQGVTYSCITCDEIHKRAVLEAYGLTLKVSLQMWFWHSPVLKVSVWWNWETGFNKCSQCSRTLQSSTHDILSQPMHCMCRAVTSVWLCLIGSVCSQQLVGGIIAPWQVKLSGWYMGSRFYWQVWAGLMSHGPVSVTWGKSWSCARSFFFSVAQFPPVLREILEHNNGFVKHYRNCRMLLCPEDVQDKSLTPVDSA